jgi:F0F1-type ATP synthase assembly protein I
MPEPGPESSGDAGLRGRDLIGLGGLLSAAVIFGTVAGVVVDHLAGTEPTFTLIGVAVGVVAGCLGFWVRVREALRQP